MAVSWTKEQQQVIDARGCNLLVSAAAGSGKTAVLVERIITKITDPIHPLDIDRLLVVTFTNAAAAEMKNRIGDALEKRLEAEPDNTHLRRQTALINHAKIMTIHSFCSYLIHNYFSRISLDPDFRIAEEGELTLLQGDVLKDLLEEAYESQSEAFFSFVESYAMGKTDGGLEDYILNLYRFAMSYPFPEEQLKAWREGFCAGENGAWLSQVEADVHRKAEELLEQCEYALALCREEDGPYIYTEMLTDDWHQLKVLSQAVGYGQIQGLLERYAFMALSRKRPKDIDLEKKEIVKGLRDQMKKTIQDMKKLYGAVPAACLMEEDETCQEAVDVLVSLTLAFMERFDRVKREKNILDFGDLEHLALEILLDETKEGHVPSDVALELGEHFDEILIDEYQDSNRLQETLLTAVSGVRFGRYNLFRVGDVKQSIYRFRLARPELFMEKFHTYGLTEEEVEKSHCRRIDLHRNFRSRPEVLDSANRVFYQIMGESLGGVEYDKDAALYVGRADEAKSGFDTELCLVETKEAEDDLSERELEAKAVAQKIRQMTMPGTGFSYRDVAILLRTYAGWAETFAESLEAEGIPAFVQAKTGYFDTQEVATVLNFLRVIDNPRQDIPLAAVLKSPMAGVTTEEMAVMMATYRNADFGEMGKPLTEAEMYEAFLWYEENGEGELKEKLAKFGLLWRRMRERARVLSTYELLCALLTESGYDLFVAAMPGGEARTANLEMLKQKAIAYEATSYHGLFDFVRYIENLRKYEMDFGEASLIGENENAVRIYSIHKSKGLEFPICFVCGMNKTFNQSDSRRRILLHSDLGLATDVVDPVLRTRRASLRKRIVADRLKTDSLGEELRVLYVAMTRAKEKLIMTAAVKDVEKSLEEYEILRELPGKHVPFTFLAKATSYLDWLLMAYSRDSAAFLVSTLSLADVVTEEVEYQLGRNAKRTMLEEAIAQPLSEDEKDLLDEQLSFRYPFEKAVRMHRKVSVSDLKKAAMETLDGAELFEKPKDPEAEENATKTGLSGADRGTAYHRFLECLTYGEVNADYVRQEKLRLLAERKMTETELDCIREEDMVRFLASPLGKRMALAEARGELKRESQFVMGVSSEEAGLTPGLSETLLVQGIMDACFLEEGAWILVDYKTDRVPYPDGEQILRDRYRVQLDYYRRALEQMTQIPVRECWIYAFALGRGFALTD